MPYSWLISIDTVYSLNYTKERLQLQRAYLYRNYGNKEQGNAHNI